MYELSAKNDRLSTVIGLCHIRVGVGDKHLKKTVDVVFFERGISHKSPKGNRVTTADFSVIGDSDSRRNRAALSKPFLHMVKLRNALYILVIANHIVGVVFKISA